MDVKELIKYFPKKDFDIKKSSPIEI